MRRLTLALALALAGAAAGGTSALATVDAPVPTTGTTPFAPNCNGAPQSGTLYRNTEPEPWIDVDPTSLADVNGPDLIGVYQQDRFSTGGANGLGTSVSRDGGETWTGLGVGSLPKFSRCAGAAPGTPTDPDGPDNGDYERASDPWVSFGPDGDAYQISLSFNDTRDLANAVLVSESRDGGQTWRRPQVLRRDTSPTVFNDKESLTADYTNANFVYAVWDRLVFPNERSQGRSYERAAAFRGPTWFARTHNGGTSWEPARPIFDPGQNDQTIGNQIVVMPDGDLVNGFALLQNDNKDLLKGGSVAVIRSTNRGSTWSDQIIVSRLGAVGVTDPRDGEDVRTGDIIPEIASDERGASDSKCSTGDCVYMVWQDARFTNSQRDQIAFSKSTDGGRTWSRPVRINKVPGTQAFTPAIRVDDHGNIGVTYYDFRNDTTASPTLDTDLWFLRSRDGGQTWSEERVTDSSFDMRTAPFARGYFVGDYQGLTAYGNEFGAYSTLTLPPFNDSQGATGLDTQNRTDVFFARAHPPFP